MVTRVKEVVIIISNPSNRNINIMRQLKHLEKTIKNM